MKLDKKKQLAMKVLKVGKGRVIFDSESLAEIKEAITKQDIRDLFSQGIIKIKGKKGKKRLEKRKTKRKSGKRKKRVRKEKKDYVRITRKLRRYVLELRKSEKISKEDYKRLRKEIKARAFKSKSRLKEHLETG